MEKRICPECGGPIVGRSDRKFCSSECKTAYNNRVYRSNHSDILRINRILKKNHAILTAAVKETGGRCTSKYLFGKGFNFDYFTSIGDIGQKKKPVKILCYEIAYTIDCYGIVSITLKYS